MSNSWSKTGRSNSVRDLFLIMGDGISFTSAAIRRRPAYGEGDLQKKKVITCLSAENPTIFLQINNSTGPDLRNYLISPTGSSLKLVE